jgi:Tfp pilus assembly protein PilO
MALDLNRRPSKREQVYAAVIFIVLVVVVARMWWFPAQAGIGDLKTEQHSLELQVDALNNLINAMMQQAQVPATARVGAVDSKDQKIYKMLEKISGDLADEVSRATHELSSRSLLSGLKMRGFQALGAEQEGNYARVPIMIDLRGSFGSFSRFLRNLENAPLPLRIETMTLAEVEKSPGIVDAALKVYLYLPSREGAAPATAAAAVVDKKKP